MTSKVLPDALLVIVDQGVGSDRLSSLVDLAHTVLGAGAGWLWYRNWSDRADRQTAEAASLQRLVAERRAVLSVGERADIASAVGAAGVHLSAHGIPASAARSLPGIEWVGRSCHDADEAARAADEGVDYITLSPVFETISRKPGGIEQSRPPLGLETLHRVALSTPVPIVALGGIRPDRVAACVSAGARGVAVLGTVAHSDDPRAAVVELRRALRRAVGGTP